MSWQDYVDKQLLASRCVTRAAIAGHDGNVWAKSEGFEVSHMPRARGLVPPIPEGRRPLDRGCRLRTPAGLRRPPTVRPRKPGSRPFAAAPRVPPRAARRSGPGSVFLIGNS